VEILLKAIGCLFTIMNGLREFQGDDDVRIFYKRINAVNEIRVFGGCRGAVEKWQFEAFLREAKKI
jgi:hypothetical protein